MTTRCRSWTNWRAARKNWPNSSATKLKPRSSAGSRKCSAARPKNCSARWSRWRRIIPSPVLREVRRAVLRRVLPANPLRAVVLGQSGGQSGSGGKPAATDPRVQQSLDRLKQATDDMRRATSPQQSEAEARRAADRLKEATDLLGGMRQQQSSSKVDALADEASRLAKEQRDQSDRLASCSDSRRTDTGPVLGTRANLPTIASNWPRTWANWKRISRTRRASSPPTIRPQLPPSCARRSATCSNPIFAHAFSEARTGCVAASIPTPMERSRKLRRACSASKKKSMTRSRPWALLRSRETIRSRVLKLL